MHALGRRTRNLLRRGLRQYLFEHQQLWELWKRLSVGHLQRRGMRQRHLRADADQRLLHSELRLRRRQPLHGGHVQYLDPHLHPYPGGEQHHLRNGEGLLFGRVHQHE